jgi:hypothetical protein
VIKVFARQHSKTYAFFEVDLTNGGRNPIPLQTGDDLNNINGYRSTDMATTNGTFTVGEIINGSVSDTQGIVTAYTVGTKFLEYYLIGDPLTDFSNTDTITGASSTATGIVVTPSNANSASTNVDIITVVHANTTADIDEDETNENYSILVDCSSLVLQTVQEKLKYITRRGETSTSYTDGQQGQFYLGSDYRLDYDVLSGTVGEGSVVTQLDSLATGTVVAHHTTPKIVILRSSRGTFVANGTTSDRAVQVDGSNWVTMTTSGSSAAATITPIASSPFGTFAGGKFFGAPGVLLINVPSADATNFQLIDDSGNVVVPPNKVTVTAANTRDEDRIAIFRLTGAGGTIDKSEYTVNTDVQGIASTTLILNSNITADTPGKTAGGALRIVDSSAQLEYRIRFGSWATATFKLAGHVDHDNSTGVSLDASTSTTSIVAHTSETKMDNILVGDLVYNVNQTAYSYVTAITQGSSDTATISPAIASQSSADTIHFNVLPIIAEVSVDNVYVPILDKYETTGTDVTSGTESATLTYLSDIEVRVVARNSNSTASSTTPMLPYTADATVVSTGLTNNIIRTQDTIKT